MEELPFTFDNHPFLLSVDKFPAPVPGLDRSLLFSARAHVAAMSFRALPGAVFFLLLIRVRGADGKPPVPPPNLAFSGLEHLLTPDDFRIGARAVLGSGESAELPVSASGGGGDGSFDYQAWFPLPHSATALTLWTKWPEQGFPEQTADLDLPTIRHAAARSTPIW